MPYAAATFIKPKSRLLALRHRERERGRGWGRERKRERESGVRVYDGGLRERKKITGENVFLNKCPAGSSALYLLSPWNLAFSLR